MSWLWLGDQETTMWCEIQAPDAVWSPVTSPLDEWSSFHLGAATHPALINSLPDSTYFDILRQGLTMDVAMAVLELTLQTRLAENSQRSTCFCFLEGVCRISQLLIVKLNTYQPLSCSLSN